LRVTTLFQGEQIEGGCSGWAHLVAALHSDGNVVDVLSKLGILGHSLGLQV